MLKIAYFSCPPSGNAGDTVITAATKQIFERFHGPIRWVEMDFRKKTSLLDVLTCRKSDAVLIGGGGLFLKDTNPNKVSGWQWKIPIWKLKLLKKPLIMYALGWNRFRGQEDFDDIFYKHIYACSKIAKFVGLRDYYSKEALFWDTDHYQPCPSIFYETAKKVTPYKGSIAFEIATDRPQYRFGSLGEGIIGKFAEIAVDLRLKGYRVTLVTHVPPKSQGGEFVDLSGCDADEVVNFYKQFKFVIGMRSHSQLIPFGQGCKIISLISHNKLKWFLEDIECPELGIEVTDPDLAKKVVDLVENYPSEEKLAKGKEKLWEITQKNHDFLKTLL